MSLRIDEEDRERVSLCSWYWDGRYFRTGGGGVNPVTLHEFLMGKAPKGFEWDHIDLDTTNNCKSNLRLATRSQNRANRNKPMGNYSSKYKGVSWDSRKCKWHAQIGVDGKKKHLGDFDNEEDAARAYNKAAKEYFGEFARENLNVPIA